MTAGPEEISIAVARLRAGGVVAFPTETVYGLGADALREEAIARVFALKGRPSTNPLIVHVCDEEMARTHAASWPERARRLAARFWPGPLTIIVDRGRLIPPVVTAGGATVGMRCPAHPLALALIETFGGPLVGPSANRSGGLSPTSAAHVAAAFSADDVYVLDGGVCQAGIESTVVWVAAGPVRVLRPGVIGAEAIELELGEPVETVTASAEDREVVLSPGMHERHYAPATPCMLADAADMASVGDMDVVVGFVSPKRTCRFFVAMPNAARAYAARLYAALHEADAAGGARIVIERPPAVGATAEETAIWRAVGDRLRRACAAEGRA
ncbi:MAG: threonylcarbamoyl-AMP synthase [Phycisphaeraceae bacterium]|nr:threonylcarbamoyl-AMP synthase [Phycisphaeraceae bacterium]